MLQKLVGN